MTPAERAERERLIKWMVRTLKWYANPEHYNNDDWGVHSVIQPPEYGSPGKKARAVLAALASFDAAHKGEG